MVISDFVGPVDWQRSLRALSGRHELIGVEVLDPLDLTLPDIGLATLLDPETGRTREVRTTPALRAQLRRAGARPPRRGGVGAAPVRRRRS